MDERASRSLDVRNALHNDSETTARRGGCNAAQILKKNVPGKGYTCRHSFQSPPVGAAFIGWHLFNSVRVDRA